MEGTPPVSLSEDETGVKLIINIIIVITSKFYIIDDDDDELTTIFRTMPTMAMAMTPVFQCWL